MKDEDKTKVELIKDLKTLRKKREKSAVNNITKCKQAEGKLQDSEEYLKMLFDYAPGAYYISDLKGNFIGGNKAAEKLTGYKVEELIGKSFLKLKLLSLAAIPKAAKLLVKNLRGQLTGPDEFVLHRKDNSKVTVEISTYPIKIKGRTLVLGIARDITQRKKAENKLRESEAKLKEAQRIAQVGSWEYDTSTDALHWSDEVYRIFNLKPQQFGATYKAFLDNIHPDDRVMVDKAYTESVKNKLPFDIVHRLLLKDGTLKFVRERCETFYDDTGKALCSIGTVQDITELRQAEERIKHLNLVLYAIRKVNQLIVKEKNRERLLKGACNNLIKTRGYYHAQIVLLDEEGKIDTYTEAGLGKEFLPLVKLLKKGEVTPCGRLALKQRDVVIIENSTSACPDCPLVQACSARGSVMAARLEHDSTIYGIMSISIPVHFITDKEEQALFKEVTGDIALGLHGIKLGKKLDKQTHDLQQSYQRTKRAMDATIETMSKIVEAKDPYTSGHQRRVSQLATAIAKEIHLSQDKIEGIRIASLIHDIGKIGLPTEILSKPTKLTDIEFSLIKEHSQIGYDILKSIDFSYPVANIILQHHERLNGSGYPHHLKGDQIFLEACILGVADVVEAMSSHRPYRAALGIDKALEEISQNRGILYDPKVVEACLKLFKEKGFKFE